MRKINEEKNCGVKEVFVSLFSMGSGKDVPPAKGGFAKQRTDKPFQRLVGCRGKAPQLLASSAFLKGVKGKTFCK